MAKLSIQQRSNGKISATNSNQPLCVFVGHGKVSRSHLNFVYLQQHLHVCGQFCLDCLFQKIREIRWFTPKKISEKNIVFLHKKDAHQ